MTGTDPDGDGSSAVSLAAIQFAGAGEMRARCRAHDWSATELGPIEDWPQSLRTTAATVLGAGFPGMVQWGPDLVQIYNDAYIPFLGDKHPSALGIPARECWPEAATVTESICSRVFEGDTVTLPDERYPLHRHGRDALPDHVYRSPSFSPVLDDGGRIAGVFIALLDATAQAGAREIDATIITGRARLPDVLRQARVAIAVLRGSDARELVYEFANPSYAEIVPAGREIVGRPLCDVLPELTDALLDDLQNVLATGQPFVARGYPVPLHRDEDGRPEDDHFNIVYSPLTGHDGSVDGVVSIGSEVSDVGPVRDASGAVIGLLDYTIDVTAQVRARREGERLLAASERAHHLAEAARSRMVHLYALAAALSTATTVPDVAAAVVTHSAAVFGAVGVVIARLNAAGDGLEIMQVEGMPDETRDAWRHIATSERVPLADVVRTGDAIFLESPDDWSARYPRLVPLLAITGHAANAVAPLVADGRVLGALGVAFDRPHPFDAEERSLVLAVAAQCAQALERARLHDAERDARRDAEAANRGKSEFLAIMSHELRTPLNAIDGYAELMELGIRGPITDQQRQDLARIRRSQRHLLGLVNGLLNYSRAEAGALHYEMEDVPLDEVLATCEALIAPQVRTKGLSLVNAGCEPLVAARADREKLRQVILNLLTNAMKFTDPGGRIDLGCHRAGHDVCVTVADTGRGIPITQIARVFEPFVQLDASLTRTQDGVGLGLAISRDLARGMRGELTVESSVGVGSVFTLTLRSA